MFDKLNIDYAHINSPSSSELFELPTDKSRVVFCDANCLQCISIRQEVLCQPAVFSRDDSGKY